MKTRYTMNYAVIFILLMIILLFIYDKINNTVMKNTKHKVIRVPVKIAVPVNIPTQQIMSYKQIGYLHSESSSMMLPLFGRRVNINHTMWNYYTKSDNHNYSINIPLVIKGRSCDSEYGCKELYDNDSIYIEEYDQLFKVKMYDLQIRYNSFI